MHWRVALDVLRNNQSTLADELRQFRQDHAVINSQLQDLNTRLHMGNIGCKLRVLCIVALISLFIVLKLNM